jgi:hypothetical protein
MMRPSAAMASPRGDHRISFPRNDKGAGMKTGMPGTVDMSVTVGPGAQPAPLCGGPE